MTRNIRWVEPEWPHEGYKAVGASQRLTGDIRYDPGVKRPRLFAVLRNGMPYYRISENALAHPIKSRPRPN